MLWVRRLEEQITGFLACVRGVASTFSKRKALEAQVNGAGWAPPLPPADGEAIETGMGLFGLYHFGIG